MSKTGVVFSSSATEDVAVLAAFGAPVGTGTGMSTICTLNKDCEG